MADFEPAVTVFFEVKIDEYGLGRFDSCEGLGVEVVMEQREEGGNNGFIWQLPTRLKYTNIKLSRAIGPDTAKVATWLSEMTTQVTRKTGTIIAMTSDRKPVATWNLREIVPVRWTGPNLSVDSPKAAMETIEIAHHGFLPS
jgi:phage tail-like protein